MPIRILIADDHAVFRSGLRMLLEKESDFVVVGEAATGAEALRAVEATPADVLLLDLSLPELPGSQVAEAVIARRLPVAIVVLTMHEDETYLRELLRIGARAFVLKKSTATDLVSAVRAAWRGEQYVDPTLAARFIAARVVRPARAARPGTIESLTPREHDALTLLALGHTNAEIAGRLAISERTVETHRASLMSKLGLKTRAELVRFALQHGLLSLG